MQVSNTRKIIVKIVEMEGIFFYQIFDPLRKMFPWRNTIILEYGHNTAPGGYSHFGSYTPVPLNRGTFSRI